MRLSIIIPVYKVEKYLTDCLDSIFCQNVPDMEVIAVNDGSPDGSLDILRDYEKRNNNMRVIDQPNQGVSVARNAGLDAATGEYIMFVDPDDWLQPTIAQLLDEAHDAGEPDLVIAGYSTVSASGVKADIDITNPGLYKGTRQCLDNLVDVYEQLYVVPWSKMFRRDFITRNNGRFEVGLNRFQDAVFNFSIYPFMQSLLLCKTRCYTYRFNVNNANNRFFGDKIFEYCSRRFQAFNQFYSDNFTGKKQDDMLERSKSQDAFIWLSVIYALYRSKTSHRKHWLKKIFNAAADNNPRWLDYYTYSVPKLIAKVGPRSLTLCHIMLWSIFKADKARKALRRK